MIGVQTARAFWASLGMAGRSGNLAPESFVRHHPPLPQLSIGSTAQCHSRNHRPVPSLIPHDSDATGSTLEIVIALIIGFALGYGIREWISRRRRQAERRRLGRGHVSQ
jgi:hypothetical protein